MAFEKRVKLIMGLFVFFFSFPGEVTPAALGKKIRSLVQSAIKDRKTFQGKKIGTGNFVYAGKPTRLGAYIAKQVQVALFRMSSEGGFEVLDRNHLCQLAREHGLWTDDRFQDSDAQKLGNLKGLDALAVGDMEVFGHQLMININILDTETSTIMAAMPLEVTKNKDISKLLGKKMPSYCPKFRDTKSLEKNEPGKNFQIKFKPMKKLYKIGEELKFRFTTTKDAYVTLVDLGTSGDVTIIFPNRFTKDNFVQGGQTVAVPSKESNFEFVLIGNPGRENVRAIATEKRVNFLPKDFYEMKRDLRPLSRKESTTLIRDISAEKSKISSSRWTEDRISFEIR